MEELKQKLLADLTKLGVTPCSILRGKKPNPYPIGTRAVYVLATWREGKSGISDSHKWKMSQYFEN